MSTGGFVVSQRRDCELVKRLALHPENLGLASLKITQPFESFQISFPSPQGRNTAHGTGASRRCMWPSQCAKGPRACLVPPAKLWARFCCAIDHPWGKRRDPDSGWKGKKGTPTPLFAHWQKGRSKYPSEDEFGKMGGCLFVPFPGYFRIPAF